MRLAPSALRRLACGIVTAAPSVSQSLGADGQIKAGRIVMLTRRRFAGFAPCAICAVRGFIATEASAQGAPAATTPGVTRTILSQTDGPTPGYTTMLVEATIEAGVPVARHTHPGVESAYVLEGGFELS